KIYEYLLSWFSSPAGMFLETGSKWYLLARALGTVILLLAWLYASRLRAQSSGWAALSEIYRSPQEPEGVLSPNASIFLGGDKYWKSVSLATAKQGLYLRISWLLRPFHTPLLLPWSDIEDAGKVGYGGGEYHKLLLNPRLKIPLLVEESVYAYLAESYAAVSRQASR
ncbi:MAG TPA: hypothetical protein PLL10_05675, partial [Elusimicrobiales bacterium]|nr:hypothetical protein [Elusimicrobiales bacterium]